MTTRNEIILTSEGMLISRSYAETALTNRARDLLQNQLNLETELTTPALTSNDDHPYFGKMYVRYTGKGLMMIAAQVKAINFHTIWKVENNILRPDFANREGLLLNPHDMADKQLLLRVPENVSLFITGVVGSAGTPRVLENAYLSGMFRPPAVQNDDSPTASYATVPIPNIFNTGRICAGMRGGFPCEAPDIMQSFKDACDTWSQTKWNSDLLNEINRAHLETVLRWRESDGEYLGSGEEWFNCRRIISPVPETVDGKVMKFVQDLATRS